MNVRNERRYEMLVRVRDFGAAHAHLFPESSLAREAIATVAATVAQLQAHDLAVTSASAAMRAERKGAARTALADFLVRMRDTARVLLPNQPGVSPSTFELPPKMRDQVTLTIARAFARDSAPLAAAFIAHGMPATFPADLDERIRGLEAALSARGISRDEKVKGRTRISQTLDDGARAVKTLDVFIANHLETDAVTRAAWDQLSRVAYPPSRKRGVPSADASEPATTAVAA